MKYTRQIFMALVCMFLTINASATSVTKENAAKVATNYLSGVVMPDGTTRAAVISESFDIQKDGTTVLYVFNFEKGGYAIVSADDRFSPIVGYSPDGYYDQDNMPDGFEFLLEEFSDMIVFIRERDIAAQPEYTEKWQRYADDNPMDRVITTVVIEPLTALWSQDSPYNFYCPDAPGGPGGKSWGGCAAAAMSIIMYYWRWPWQGTGENTYRPQDCNGVQMPVLEVNFGETFYDYNGMYGTPETTADDYLYEPLALLQYHAGVSLNMQYCGNESGAYPTDVRPAMINYFKYNPDIKYVLKDNISTEDWADMLKEQLDLGQPVFTSGRSPTIGHGFVCDGYDTNGMFHYNFGWSGLSNGYFFADNPWEFTTNFTATINITPDRSQGYPADCNGNRVLPYMRGVLSDCSGPIDNYAQGVTATWLIDPARNGNEAENFTITCNEFDLAAGDYLEIYDGENESATSLGKFSGSETFEPVTSTGGKVLVKFTSSTTSATAKGFMLTYQATEKQYCQEIIFTTPTGQFTDGSPEDMNYVNSSMNCKWFIEPAGATLDSEITFEFLRLDTEEGKDEIKFINYEGAKPIGTISGSYGPDDELPIVVAKKAKGVMVTFTSNAFINGKGFEIKYSTDPVSIKEVENINNLVVYPNPASEKLNITFNTSTTDDFNITIYNVTGQAVYKETLNNFVGSYYNEINVNDLAQGVYLMQVKSSKGAVTQKIVVQ